MKKFLLNIAQRKIHNGLLPCYSVSKMAEANKKYFDTYEEAENYYAGGSRKGEICNICFKSKEEAIKLKNGNMNGGKSWKD